MRTVLAIMLGVVLSLSAQASSLVGSITGRAVNAAGGAVANQRVDLVRGGQVVNVAITDRSGAWTFPNVAAGEYTVRTSVNGKIAGVRVMVADGAAVTAPALVVPTAAVAPQFGALAGALANAVAAAGVTATQIAAAGVIDTEATNLSAEQVVAIFNTLDAAQQVAFAKEVTAATSTLTQTSSSGGNAFKPAEIVNNSTTSTTVTQNNNASAVFQVLQVVATTPTNAVTSNSSRVVINPPTTTTTGNGTTASSVTATIPAGIAGRTTTGTIAASAS